MPPARGSNGGGGGGKRGKAAPPSPGPTVLTGLGGNAMMRIGVVCLVVVIWIILFSYIYSGDGTGLDTSKPTTFRSASGARQPVRPTTKRLAKQPGVAAGLAPTTTTLGVTKKKGQAQQQRPSSAGPLLTINKPVESLAVATAKPEKTTLPFLIDFTIRSAAEPTYLRVDFDIMRKEYLLDAVDKPLDINRKFVWDLTPQGEIRNVGHTDQCLTMLSDASMAHSSPCVYKMTSQRWIIETDGRIRNQRRTDLCLAYTDHIYMAACTSDVKEIQWQIGPSRDAMLSIILRLGLEPVDRIRDASAFEDALQAFLKAPSMERVEIVLLKLSMESEDPIMMLVNQYRESFNQKQMNVRVLPSLLTGVSASMHINNAVSNGGRFVTVIDHVSEILAAGPHFYANAVQILFTESATKSIAIPSSPNNVDKPLFSQGCRCLKKIGVPERDLSAVLPALASAVPPVVPRNVWVRSGGLHYMPMGARSRRDCQMTDFWIGVDAMVGIMPAYIDGNEPKTIEATVQTDGFSQCPADPYVAADQNSVVITSTVDEPFVKSWLMLRNPEFFTVAELMFEQCRLVLSASGFLHSEEFEAYKRKYLSVDAHVLYMEGMRQEGANSLMSARTSYNFLVFGSRLDGTRRISIWPYLHRHHVIARPQPLMFSTMEECVQPVKFNPAETLSGGISIKPITKDVAVSFAKMIDDAVASKRPVFHYIITFKDPDNRRFPFLSIESVFFHHADAIVFVHSDVLSDTDVESFTSRNLNVTVVPLATLRFEGTVFWYPLLVQHIEQLFGKERMWFYALADLYKYWVLERFGGIALDYDVILIKPMNLGLQNVIGLDSGTISANVLKEEFSVNGNVMIFERNNSFIQRVMLYIPRRFKADQVASVGSRLLTHVLQRSPSLRVEDDMIKAEGVTVLNKDLFNPVPGIKTNLKMLHMALISDKAWDSFIQGPAVALHYFQRASGTTETMTNSLADRALTSFCKQCEPPGG